MNRIIRFVCSIVLVSGLFAAPAAAADDDCTTECLAPDDPVSEQPETPAPDFGSPVVDDPVAVMPGDNVQLKPGGRAGVMPGDRVTPLTDEFDTFLKAKKAF
jgi:hypothetical protein